MAAAPIIEMPNTAPVEAALTMPETALKLKVTNAVGYSNGGEILKTIKGLRDRVNEEFGPGIAKAHALHKELCAQRNKYLAPLDTAEGHVKRQMVLFENEERRRAQEEERRIQEELARKQREEALAAAVEAEEQGAQEEEVQAILEAPPAYVPVVVAPSIPKIAGVGSRGQWKAKVTDKAALIRAAANNPQLAALLDVNMSALNQMARALKSTLNIPGVQAYEDRTMTSR